jgi:16S rRNA (guanine527-N7)-methyltransferase
MVLKEKIITFGSFYNVSRETIDILEKYEKILIRDSKSLNLIGKSTFNQIWNRHFLDSFQDIYYIDKK